MEAPLVLGAYERTNSPSTYLLNAYPEERSTATGPRSEVRARPGLNSLGTVGSSASRGVHFKDGLFGGSALFVQGTAVYKVTDAGAGTLLSGSLLGTSLVDIASWLNADEQSEAWVATGSALYVVNGTNNTVTRSDFPSSGGAGATSVCTLRSFLFAVEAATDKVYYRLPNATTWNALQFASAEYSPDPIVAVRAVGELLALLGSASFEAWTVASGTPAPFGGIAFNIGCRSRDAAVVCGDALVFVDHHGIVRRWEGGELVPIGDEALAEQIVAVPEDSLSAWCFSSEGHEFYVLHLGDAETWVHDLHGPPKRWAKWESPDLSYWRARMGANVGDTVLAADAINATVWAVDPDERYDGDVVFPWEGSALIPAAERPQPVSNLVFDMEVGDAPLSGQGSDPTLLLRWSDNGGKTFNEWKSVSMPATGYYNRLPRKNACGTIPANRDRIIRYRVSDPIGRRMSRVLVNVT